MFKKFIPNLLTFTNLAFGIVSILEIIKRNYSAAALFIIAAAFIDRYDGRIARFLNVSSELGKELDSLADIVSFGVAPAFLIFNKFNFLGLSNIKAGSVCFLLLYTISGCYRLAKYNISKFNGIFTGIPITIAGSIIALYSLAIPSNNNISTPLSIILLMLLSYFMVSKFEFIKI